MDRRRPAAGGVAVDFGNGHHLAGTAVIAVDLLRDYVLPGGADYSPRAASVLPAACRLLSAARAAGVPVIHSASSAEPGCPMHRVWGDAAMEGTPGASVVPDAWGDGDLLVAKRGYDGFHDTGLAGTLRGMGVSRVLLCGVVTHVCVLSTAITAFHEGFSVAVALGATGAGGEEQHSFALRFMERQLGAELVAEPWGLPSACEREIGCTGAVDDRTAGM